MQRKPLAPKARLIPKVKSLGELQQLAARDERYARLAVTAASNLGGPIYNSGLNFPYSPKQQEIAMRWLRLNAQETTEEGVVDEVNFCRDLI